MKGSIQRVRTIIQGGTPDRPPLFDLLRNDAVIEHFTGQTLTIQNGSELVYKAYAPAVDATRPCVRAPNVVETLVLPDGRQQQNFRWTSWIEHRRYPDSETYARHKREQMDASTGFNSQEGVLRTLQQGRDDQRKLGEVFYFYPVSSPGLMSLYGEVGLEEFCYYLVDCPDVIVALLEHNTLRAESLARSLPPDHGIEGGFLADDIAFRNGPLFDPEWLRTHYFPRLARCIAAWHARGIKVLFHSDGNLNPILDDLVDAGIDGLNPIEVMAGMDIADIHRRHPHLFMAGGIDVSQLLPFGTPQQVRDAVRRAIDTAEGRLLVGSSTELNDNVPLANYLALREVVLQG